MAHVSKFGRGATGHLAAHFERRQDEEGKYIKFGNQDIDTALSGDNYNLAPERDMPQTDFIRQRCGEVKCLARKDVKVLCSWVVTAPKEISGTPDESKFFAEAYKFLKGKYGEENTVSAYVHKDEITPHMHYAFVPVVADQRSGELKVSAKECLPKSALKSFHGELSRYMEQAFGRDIGVLNQSTVEGNKAINELKRGTAVQQLQELTAEVSKTQTELSNLQKRVLGASEVQRLAEKGKKGLLGGLKDISFSEYEKLLQTAQAVDLMAIRVAAADRRTHLAEQQVTKTKNEVLEQYKDITHQREILERDRVVVEQLKEKTPDKMLLKRNRELSEENMALKSALGAVKNLFKFAGKSIKEAVAKIPGALENCARIEKALGIGQSREIER